MVHVSRWYELFIRSFFVFAAGLHGSGSAGEGVRPAVFPAVGGSGRHFSGKCQKAEETRLRRFQCVEPETFRGATDGCGNRLQEVEGNCLSVTSVKVKDP